MTDSIPEAGFNRRRPTYVPYFLLLREDVGLSADASLAEIEPVAIEMMRAKKIIEAMELVLNRYINSEDVAHDEVLSGISLTAMRAPEQAFGLLLMQATIEEIQAEQQ